MKYLIGVGVLVVVAVGAFVLFSGSPPSPAPAEVVAAPSAPAAEPTPVVAPAPVTAPRTAALPTAPPLPTDQDEWLLAQAANTRESLPSSVTDRLTMTDALFLPRMRIMEYTYVTTAEDARATARTMRALIDSGAEQLCLEGREMFELGVTLRNSFEDRDGVLFQRVYLLPEDCRQFY